MMIVKKDGGASNIKLQAIIQSDANISRHCYYKERTKNESLEPLVLFLPSGRVIGHDIPPRWLDPLRVGCLEEFRGHHTEMPRQVNDKRHSERNIESSFK